MIPEFVIQASFVIRGAAEGVGSQLLREETDLNVMEPIIALHLSDSLLQLANVARPIPWRMPERAGVGRRNGRASLSGSFKGAVEHAAIVGHDACAVSKHPSRLTSKN